MTLDPGVHADRDAARLAVAARSVLACPGEVQLVVDGIDDLTAGLEQGHLEMQDRAGRPVFSCPADSALARAAADGRGAIATIASGFGRPGSPDRDVTLTLWGRLEASGLEACPCCPDPRMRIGLHLDRALLSPGEAAGGDHRRVPLALFASSEHDLNPGFLQRSVEHANLCHQAELRRAVSATTGTRLGEVLGAQLLGLRPDGVELQWVDVTGAHRTELRFRRTASSPEEVGELLRTELHAGLC